MDLVHLGRCLRAERERHGWSRAALCEATGINPSTLQEIEGGTGNPELRTLDRLARGLGLSLVDIARAADGGSLAAPSTDAPSPPPVPDVADQDDVFLDRLAVALVRASAALRAQARARRAGDDSPT